MVELFAVRRIGDSGSMWFPEPGEVRDSIRLAHADGVPAGFALRRTVLRDHAGVPWRGRRHVMALPGSLIVTDCRAAVASSAAAATDAAGRMWVTHVRFGWLDEVAFCDAGVRLRFVHPCGTRMELLAHLETSAAHGDAAAEVARRATLHGAGRFTACPGAGAAGRWRRLLTTTGGAA